MTVVPIHNDGSIADAIRVLKSAGAKLTSEEKRYLAEEIERITSLLAERMVRPLSYFDHLVSRSDAKRRKKEKPKGGRPVNAPLATAMHALVNLYIQTMGLDIENWEVPAGHNSYFPRFASACLAPFLDDGQGKLTPRLAKFWERKRDEMRPKTRA